MGLMRYLLGLFLFASTYAHSAAITTFVWTGYSNGDHLDSSWDIVAGAGTEATINPDTDWSGSPKSLNLNPAAWFATVFNAASYSTSSYLGIYSRAGYNRATFVWNRSGNNCYLWQYMPQTGASTLGKDWVAGVGITTTLDSQTYVPANNKDFIRSLVQTESTIKCYVDGTQVHSISDSSYSSGSFGMEDFASSHWTGPITLFDGPTPTPTFTPTPTPVATNTFTVSPTLTPSPSPTLTPTMTPSPILVSKPLVNFKATLAD